jgi:hypothetical protein
MRSLARLRGPAGHPLPRPRRVFVGTQQCTTCSGSGDGPHRSYTCQACGHTLYDPEPTTGCSFVALDGRVTNPTRTAGDGIVGGSRRYACPCQTTTQRPVSDVGIAARHGVCDPAMCVCVARSSCGRLSGRLSAVSGAQSGTSRRLLAPSSAPQSEPPRVPLHCAAPA